MPAEVSIIQRRLTHYRAPLVERLRRLLAADGVRLRVLHGEAPPSEQSKRDAGELAWAEPLPARYLLGGRLCWQPFGAACASSDLVVVTQENRLLYNAWAQLVGRPRGRPR